MLSHTRLAADPRSAQAARRHVAEALHAWGLADHVDCAALLVSELVSNAVRHAGTELELTVSAEPVAERRRTVQVAVRDFSNRGLAFARPSIGDTGGRGLALITALAPRWGVAPCPPQGKSVWCEIVPDGAHVLPVFDVN